MCHSDLLSKTVVTFKTFQRVLWILFGGFSPTASLEGSMNNLTTKIRQHAE